MQHLAYINLTDVWPLLSLAAVDIVCSVLVWNKIDL